MKKNTRVLALVIFDGNREKTTWKMVRVLICVIYTIIGKYVCIDYLGSEKSKWSDLRLGVTGRYKHFDTDYDNVLGIRIPYLLLNLLFCHGFSKNNESSVILKCPHRMSEYYFNKGFVIFEFDEESLKTSNSGKIQSWCRSSSQFRLSHAMLYHHSCHFKYTEELVS